MRFPVIKFFTFFLINIIYLNILASQNLHALRMDSLYHVSTLLASAGKFEKALALNNQVEKMVLVEFGKDTKEFGKWCLENGKIYELVGDYSKSENLFLESLRIYEKNISKTHPDYAAALNSLGGLYRAMGRYEMAEKLHLEAKRIHEIAVGPEDPKYADILNSLGEVYSSMGKYKLAEDFYLSCKDLREKILGKEHLDYAITLNNLGVLYHSYGKYTIAKKLHIEALTIFENAVGKDHPDFASTICFLGEINYSEGMYKQAADYFLACKNIRENTIGKSHPDYALTLNNLGLLYDNIGDYDRSESYYLECMNIQEVILGKDHPDYAITLGNLGQLHSNKGKYEKAEYYNLECRKLCEIALGKDHPTYATSLNNLGVLYLKMGKYSEIEALFIECKDVREKIIGKSHPQYASIMSSLGAYYEFKGQYEKAELYYLECKDIYEKNLGEEHFEYAISLNNLGLLNKTIGKYDVAASYYSSSKRIIENTFGKNHPNYAMILLSMGQLSEVTGNYDEAELHYFECKDIYEKTYGKNHPDYATTLASLGFLYYSIGDYEKAEKNYLDCQAIYETTLGKDHPSYASVLQYLGSLYESMGQYSKAEMYYLKGKDIVEISLGRDHIYYASALHYLGGLFESTGKYEAAVSLYTECKDILSKTLDKFHPDYATTINNLGGLYCNLGQYENAEGCYLECKYIYEKTLGKDHPDYATTLGSLGQLYFLMGYYTKAERYYIKCAGIYENTLGKEHPMFVTVAFSLGVLYESIGRYMEAESYIDAAMRTSHKKIHQSVLFLSEKDLGEYLKKESIQLDNIPIYLHSGHFSSRMAELAYDDALFQKGFLQTAARRLNTLTATNQEADSLSQLLASHRHRISREYTKPKVARNVEITELEERANAIEGQLARLVYGYAEAIQQVNWREVQASLKPNEIAIEFLRFKISRDTVLYGALLLRKGMEFPVYLKLCDERDFGTLMIQSIERRESYVNQLYSASERGIELSKKQVRSLYDLLWRPVEPYLMGVRTVYYANAGLLHRINLGAINLALDTVLANRYTLVELGSTRSLVVQEKVNMANNQALVMGGINYDNGKKAQPATVFDIDSMAHAQQSEVTFSRTSIDSTFKEYWGTLPYSGKEADTIGLLLQKSKIPSLLLKGYNATEEAFYKSVRHNGTSPRIIHLATHGYFLPDPKSTGKESIGSVFRLSEHPLIRSGLILAGGNQAWMTGQSDALGQEDGILTAYEISRLNLTGTELVVLSACETGLGDIQGNEGVYGLQRAFKIAGVRYVIMSLWQVPDQQSSIFMTTFYQRWLEQGISIPEAFRQTQAEMRKKGWSHHQWAGFVLLE